MVSTVMPWRCESRRARLPSKGGASGSGCVIRKGSAPGSQGSWRRAIGYTRGQTLKTAPNELELRAQHIMTSAARAWQRTCHRPGDPNAIGRRFARPTTKSYQDDLGRTSRIKPRFNRRGSGGLLQRRLRRGCRPRFERYPSPRRRAVIARQGTNEPIVVQLLDDVRAPADDPAHDK